MRTIDIRQQLIAYGQAITASSPAGLPDPQQWPAWRRRRQRQLQVMMGLDRYLDAEATPLNVATAQTHRRDGFTIETLSYESLPGLNVAANLYLPAGRGPHPALLYLCGHSGAQKAHYQEHPRHYAQLGFVTLILDTVQLGEVRGYHHGTHGLGAFHWQSRGYTPAAVETWNAVRGLDLLAGRPEVDAGRLGVTGTSGGGAIAWWLAAVDDRVKAVSPSCGTGTIASHIRERTVDGHCDCMFPHNPHGWSLVDIGALVAPRPLLIVSAARDGHFSLDAIKDVHARLTRVYTQLAAGENLQLFTFRAPHSYQPASRRATFAWFLRHLKGEQLAADQVADLDGVREEDATLAAFPQGLPANDRAATAHDWFVPAAQPPTIQGPAELEACRAEVLAALRQEAFAAFPAPLPAPGARLLRESWSRSGSRSMAFDYNPEGDWRLEGCLWRPPEEEPSGTVVVELLARDAQSLPPGLPLTQNSPPAWSRAWLAPRGTGSTAWSPALDWHVRRSAALTGRTVASMRVLDVLQGLAALRELAGAQTPKVWLAAAGEMAVVALYAALLDGHIKGLLLFNPPATQNAADPDHGPPLLSEMLGCLKVTDLPQVAGLLWPASLVFVGPRPAAYVWTEALYRRLGEPGGIWNVPALRHWSPPR